MAYLDYLYFLQGLRESAPTFVNEGILFLSEFMGGSGALALMALVYWCISKKAGSFMLLNFSGAYMMNQTLKNIFCVSRPFLLDDRLHPYKMASGYSFPSGHTMLGTAVYSSAAIWQRQRKWFVSLCALLILLTAFGRNWIGVHTPQDVITGILVSLCVVFGQLYLMKWVEKHPGKDIYVLLGALLWAGAVLALLPGSGKVCGIFLGTYLGWFIERRWIRFETAGSLLQKTGRYLGGMVLVFALYKGLLPLVTSPFSKNTQELIIHFITFLTVTAIWPALLRLAARKKG